MKNIHIAIIDTYVDLKNPLIYNKVKYVSTLSDNQFTTCNHATSMCGEIVSICSEVEIDVYPIFKNNFFVSALDIFQALSFILEHNIKYDILMLSLGFDSTDYAIEISDVCKKLSSNGTIIISAFNNHGGLSYPACLDYVIGIDTSSTILDIDSFYIINNSPINIVCSSQPRAVIQSEIKKSLMAGTSISTAYITGLVACIMLQGKKNNEEILAALEKLATKKLDGFPSVPSRPHYKAGTKYVIFPCSKEIETLATLSEYSNLQLIDIYDFSKSINIGRIIPSIQSDFIVKGIKGILWDSFDLLVIGHIDKYISLSSKIVKEIECVIEIAISKGKYIYCFDGLLHNQLHNYKKHFVPSITFEDIPKYRNGRLWKCPIPVISIIGTGPKQGKFSTQTKLIQKFIADSYKVGSISTEPYGYLLNMDYVFPYGYNANMNISNKDYSCILNDWVYNLYSQENDVIITALQSGILPRNYSRQEEDLSVQFSILFGLNSDVVVLCVYPNDDVSIIKRTILYVKTVFQISIVLLLVYPIKHWISDSGKASSENIISSSEYCEHLAIFKKRFPGIVFEMNEIGYECAYQYIINRLQ